MKYVSLDIETTGLDPNEDQVLEIAAVIEDTETAHELPVHALPHFRAIVKHSRVSGDPYALAMHQDLLEEIAATDKPIALSGGTSYQATEDACEELLAFMHEHLPGTYVRNGKYVIAGKNVAGFDLRFLPKWFRDQCHHRTIDAGSLALGASPALWRDTAPPSLGALINTEVRHTALEDARDVIRSIREQTNLYKGGTL